MDRTRAIAVNDLREAISAYNPYCYFFERGQLLVNADDDPADIVEAARLEVGERIRVYVAGTHLRRDCGRPR
jgi:hypothetical protein